MSCRIAVSPEELLTKARRVTGIDIVDGDALGPLTVLVDSFNEDSQLHEAGARRIEAKLLRILSNRLRMLRDFEAHPEIKDQQITAPVFVAGSVRTGSTKMQRMVTASGDFNWLPFWKTLNSASYTGKPGEDPGPRIADTDAYVEESYAASPEMAHTHEQTTHEAEEESLIFMQALHCPGYMGLANVPGYLQWLARQDMEKAYLYLQDTLKYLQWQGLADPAKRWFLKCPFHCGMEDVLTGVFPDASLIVTHRPPAQLMPSMCSMLATYIKCHSDHTRVDSHALVSGFAYSLERHIAFRQSRRDFPILDVHYKDATTNVEAVIRRVYSFLDMPLLDGSLKRMLDWDASHPINRHGAHQYSLADFDLEESDVNKQCAGYLQFYEQQFSDRR